MFRLEVNHLKKTYGDFLAVNDLTFHLKSGECLGVLGKNGAGKSSTLKMIYSATAITSGSILINGQDITKHRGESKAKLGIVTQDDMLDTTLTVLENMIAHGICYNIPKSVVRERAIALLDFVNLNQVLDKQIGELSGGMRRRVSLARALINEPDIIILDEPTVGLDIQSRNLIWEKLVCLKKQGVAIMITSHYMNEIAYLSDRILVINSGCLIAEGSIAELLERYGVADLETLFLTLTDTDMDEEVTID